MRLFEKIKKMSAKNNEMSGKIRKMSEKKWRYKGEVDLSREKKAEVGLRRAKKVSCS